MELVKSVCRAFEVSACHPLLSKLYDDSTARIHISLTIHHKGKQLKLMKYFARKSISR